MSHRVTGQRWLGAVCVVAGLPWLWFSGRYLIETWAAVGFDGGQAFLVLIVLGGLAVSAFGISQFVYGETTTISATEVRRERRGLSGRRSWTEAVSNYRSVVKAARYESGSEVHTPAHHSRMCYTLYLDHADRRRRVQLYESSNTLEFPAPEWDLFWNRYAELLGLPKTEESPREGVKGRTS